MTAQSLLREAAALYDDPATRLAEAAKLASTRGFDGGAWWMRRAMRLLRGRRFPRSRDGGDAGKGKYALCAAVALMPVWAALDAGSFWPLALSPVLFYVVEVQLLFAVPLAVDGRTMRLAPRLTRRGGGTLRSLRVVLPLAASMLFGGFTRRGFLRSWCLGCLAIVIWYERVRESV